jgi:hypothetical protein
MILMIWQFSANSDVHVASALKHGVTKHRFHGTDKGSPAKLVAPATAGRYEIRYFSMANGTVLARAHALEYLQTTLAFWEP